MSTIDSRLETLLAVYEEKTFSRAAKALNLTQPAVSHHIASLEHEFQVKLFHRKNNEMEPTRMGQILIRYAKRFVAVNNEMVKAISGEKKETRSIVVGITHSSEGNIVPETLMKYSERHPGTAIRIVSDDIKKLYEKLANYEIDFAMVEGKVPLDKFSKITLSSDTVIVAVSRNHPLAKKSSITLADLRKEKLILRNLGSATRKLFQSQLDINNMSLDDFDVVMEIDNTSVIKDLVSKNMVVTVVPRSICYQELKNKSLVALPIQDMNMTVENNLVFMKSYGDQEMLEELIEIYRSLSE